MRFLKKFAGGELRLDRIEAFSDGVFAIVVTLLVLDLKVPSLTDHASVRELGAALVGLLPKYVSWLISFIIVCKFWLNHHHIFGLARHATYGLVWLNSFFLLCQSFIPFPTGLMGEYVCNPLAVSFFGAVMPSIPRCSSRCMRISGVICSSPNSLPPCHPASLANRSSG